MDDLSKKRKNNIKTRPKKRQRSANRQSGIFHQGFLGQSSYRAAVQPSWQKGMNASEVEIFQLQYDRIISKIEAVPTVKDALTSGATFADKCRLIEKINILNNTSPNTTEHLHLKTKINDEIKKYQVIAESEVEDMTEAILMNDCTPAIPLRSRVLASKQPHKTKILVYRKFRELVSIPKCSGSHAKLLAWLETVLAIPVEIQPIKVVQVGAFLKEVKYKLDKRIYGMRTAKEQILCAVNNIISNPTANGMQMAFCGPQGVGKTMLAQAVADAVNLPFISMPLGGARDASFFNGHSYTYEGSKPGAIVDALVESGQLNSVFFLDELDKISTTKRGEEIAKVMLHISDTTQNHGFKDMYVGANVKIDLSNVWFIYSLNYENQINKTLKDRLDIIQVDGYTQKEKLNIARAHLIPDALSNTGFKTDSLTFTDEAINYLITETDKVYTDDTKGKSGKSGVRQLKHVISNVVTKLSITQYKGDIDLSFKVKDFKLPYVITVKCITQLNVISEQLESDHLDMYS